MASHDNALEAELVDEQLKVTRQLLRRIFTVRAAGIAVAALVERIDVILGRKIRGGFLPHPAIARGWVQEDQGRSGPRAVKIVDIEAGNEGDVVRLHVGDALSRRLPSIEV